jgi:uncharacterized repeat protein (TIGR03803 family)
MRSRNLYIKLKPILAAFIVILFVTTSCVAGEKILLQFDNTNGANPNANLIFDAAGNLYSTTAAGGEYGFGTVFELMPEAGGLWKERVLHDFNSADGANPLGGLIFDAEGNLYGTTSAGGAYNDGIVFELTPTHLGGWAEKVLHTFDRNGVDGAYPWSSLIFDAAGNLYGTTFQGGSGTISQGTVFQLSPGADGHWAETVLVTFSDNNPWGSPILDAAGNLYGATHAGGLYGAGIVFELTPITGGGWTEAVLHNFNYHSGAAGYYPSAALIFDAAGNLYGTTFFGGLNHDNVGVVFELLPEPGGGWTEKELHSFNTTDGANPTAALIFDAAGNLYGTTRGGGANGGGTAFELTPGMDGGWVEVRLVDFSPYNAGGAYPCAGLILDAAGNLYGTTTGNGKFGYGTVFEITR